MLSGNGARPLSPWLPATVILILLVSLLLFTPRAPSPAGAAPAVCGSGLGGTVESDTVWSGDVYLDDDVTIRNNSTLTVTAGTTVHVCGDYELLIGGLFTPGNIVALGTESAPIIFRAADGVPVWEGIYLNDYNLGHVNRLEYVEIHDAGSTTGTYDAALYISDRATNPDYLSVVVDQLTVQDSASTGIIVASHATPLVPTLDHLTVTGSVGPPLRIDPDTVNGLGNNNSFLNNGSQTIHVRGENAGYDQTWKAQPVPYELLGNIQWRNSHDDLPFAQIVVEPGADFLVHPDVTLSVGNNGAPAKFIAAGTPDRPITFGQAVAGSPWRTLTFDGGTRPGSRLAFVDLDGGGGSTLDVNVGMVQMRHNDVTLALNNVTVSNSSNLGVYGSDGRVNVADSTIQGNRIGILYWGGEGQVRNSTIVANNQGVVNNSNNICIDARGNFWGHPDGPLVPAALSGDCGQLPANPDSEGDPVDGPVLYLPWLTGVPGVASDWSSIEVEPFWVALGTNGAVSVRVRDAQGTPLADKQVELRATMPLFGGTITETVVTGPDGTATTAISSTVAGFAHISGHNLTDNAPLAAVAGVTFWEPTGSSGGLVSLDGVPYNYPDLVIRGKPFQIGFPMEFSLPMRNARANPIEVEAVYEVSGLNIGAGFTPVFTASRTLQPGEAWDAPGGWTPDVTGHHCVLIRVSWTEVDGNTRRPLESGGFTRQKNTDIGSNGPPPGLFGDWKKPKVRGGSKDTQEAGKHFWNMGKKGNAANNYLDNSLRFDPPVHGYEQIVTPPALVPATYSAGLDLTAAEAAALTALDEAMTEMLSLSIAVRVTTDRMAGAAAAEEWRYVVDQRNALNSFLLDAAAAMREGQNAIGDLIAAMQNAGRDNTLYPADEFLDYYQQLQSTGFDADTLAYLQAAGLSGAEIERMRAALVAGSDQEDLNSARLYDLMDDYALMLERMARHLEDSVESQTRATTATEMWTLGQMEIPFTVGNPTAVTDTVSLVTHGVDVPLGWSFSLSEKAPELGPGATTRVTLTVKPAGNVLPRDTWVRIAVEGYVGGELAGGIMVERVVPAVTEPALYLPLMMRP